MPDPLQINLSACEQQPIRHLGFVQPHGCLLALDASGRIGYGSENLPPFLDREPDSALGSSLQAVVGGEFAATIEANFRGLSTGEVRRLSWDQHPSSTASGCMPINRSASWRSR